jgi:hypothetical protein
VTGRLVLITEGFPEPPPLVRYALGQLQVARYGTDVEQAHLGNPAYLPRPWDPPSCPPVLRHELWPWLDDVARWINHEYSWSPQHTIPGCWPAHPSVAHELAALACLRRTAGTSLAPDLLEDWHRYALPAFLDRMVGRLGNGCQPGRHTEWPGAVRYGEYVADAEADRRAQAFSADTLRPPCPPPPPGPPPAQPSPPPAPPTHPGSAPGGRGRLSVVKPVDHEANAGKTP